MIPKIPYVMEPDEHRLGRFYRRLNRIGVAALVVIIVLNELLLRQHLPHYLNTPEEPWSLIVLVLNGKTPASVGHVLVFLFAVLACCYAASYSLLPNWAKQKARKNLKRGLPNYEGYEDAYFFIDTKLQLLAFRLWHSVLMRMSFFLALVVPCMAINLFRA